MLVTILGPDGTGKTTLARALAEKIDGLDYVYFGYNKEISDYQFFNSFVKLEPKNIEQLAAVLAIIRPAKRGLMYKRWVDILKEVWVKPIDESYFFKKSHAVAYAHAVVIQMNLIKQGEK